MPLIAGGVIIPDILSAAILTYVVIPREPSNSAHDLAVVLKEVIRRVLEYKIISRGNIAYLETIGNSAAVIGGHAHAVEVAALTTF